MTCEQGSVDDMTNEDAPEGRVIRFVRPKRPVRVLARTDRRQVEDGGWSGRCGRVGPRLHQDRHLFARGRTVAASRLTLDHRARRSLVLNSALLEDSDC